MGVLSGLAMPLDLSKFRIPAEWEPHCATLMAVGLEEADDGWKNSEKVIEDHQKLAKFISRFESVLLLANAGDPEFERNDYVGDDDQILRLKHFDIWARDCVFITAVDEDQGRLAIIGGPRGYRDHPGYDKQAHLAIDKDFARGLANKLGMRICNSQLPLEGGGICVDGEGTLLTTETWLLDGLAPNEKAQTKLQLEQEFSKFGGISKIIWLYGSSSPGDVTRGHVDGIARFVAPALVLIQEPNESIQSEREDFEENYSRLKGQIDARGRSIELLHLKAPNIDLCSDPMFCGILRQLRLCQWRCSGAPVWGQDQ